jgi:oligopeptide transport system substrate-binding protein
MLIFGMLEGRLSMKSLLQVLLALAMIMGLNVGEVSTASAVPAKQVLRIGYEQLPEVLDPAIFGGAGSSTVLKGLFEGLVRLNKEGQAVPGIAKWWKVSNDGKTYTFTLRSNAKWSNQQPVKASDFEYAWKRALAPETESTYAFNMYMIANAEKYNTGKIKDSSKVGVKALDNYTLQVTLSEKTSYFIQLLAESVYFPVYPATAKANADWAYDINSMVTNGPFKLKQWEGDAITLVKNPLYYAAKEIHFTEVQLLQPQASTLNTTYAYMNGEVDWVGGNEMIDRTILDSAAYRDLYEMPIGSIYYYMFNVNEPPFNNIKIRKALAMAVEREAIGYGTPAFGFVPRNIRGSGPDYRTEVKDTGYFQEDVKLAKSLLQEGLKEEGLSKLPPFSISVNSGSHPVIADTVISSWKKNLGINVSVEILYWEDLLANRKDQNFTIARAGWTADYNDPSTFLEYFTSWSPNNDSTWSNPQYDSYIKRARQTFEPRERMKLYAQAEKLLIDQMAIIPLYYYVADALHKPNVKNVYVDYDGSVAFTRGNIR